MKHVDDILRVLGQTIAAKRHELGISQEELAHRAGINRTYLGDIERGARNIAVLNITKISYALEISPSELFIEVEKILPKKTMS